MTVIFINNFQINRGYLTYSRPLSYPIYFPLTEIELSSASSCSSSLLMFQHSDGNKKKPFNFFLMLFHKAASKLCGKKAQKCLLAS